MSRSPDVTTQRSRRAPDPCAGRPPQSPTAASPPRELADRFLTLARRTALAALGALAAAFALVAVRWPLQHDAPILLYMGFLIDRYHAVPYRDFFDMNLPGAYLFFTTVWRLFQDSDPLLHALDLAWMIAIVVITWRALRPVIGHAGLVAGALFATFYWRLGPIDTWQREYLLVLLLAGVLWMLSPARRWPAGLRGVIVGALFGLGMTVKPGFAIGLLPSAAYLMFDAAASAPTRAGRAGAAARVALGGALGVAVPLATAAAALASSGALRPLWDIITNYWPLYSRLGYLNDTVSDVARFGYLRHGTLELGQYRSWLVAVVFGASLLLLDRGRSAARTRWVVVMLGLLAAYALYPALSGQFWSYHWLPFGFVLACVVATCFADGAAAAPAALKIAAPLAFIVVAFAGGVRFPASFREQLAGAPAPPPLGGRVDEIAAYLKRSLQPGDTVQPLDWTGGAVHAMLRARARLATSFIYDFHFYHHIQQPYIQRLRQRFLAELDRAHPRFVISIVTRKPWVRGAQSSRAFPELWLYLGRHYQIDFVGDGYAILVRKADATPEAHTAP